MVSGEGVLVVFDNGSLVTKSGEAGGSKIVLAAVAILLSAGVGPAYAACTGTGTSFTETGTALLILDVHCPSPPNPAAGAAVDVVGNITTQLLDGAGGTSNWTVNVRPGVTITSTANVSPVFSADAGFTLDNFGSIDGAGLPGVFVGGGSTTTATITNRGGGVIESVGLGAQAHAIHLQTPNASRITNESGGLIQGSHTGILVDGAAAAINNAGTIIGNTNAVALNAGGTVQNQNWATIEANGHAIVFGNAAGTVINGGKISSTAGSAIEFAPGIFDDLLELHPGFEIINPVQANEGFDTLRFGGAGQGVFNLTTIDSGFATQQYRNFDTFEVTSGEWLFNGATNALFNVKGGTLGGTGAFGGLIVENGGTVAPGNSIGTVTVNGDVVFGAGSTYQAEIDAAGNADLVAVMAGGTTSIDPARTTLDVIAMPGAYNLNQIYTVLTSNVIQGQFANVQDNLPDIDVRAIYNPNSIQLGLTKGAPGGLTSPKAIFSAATGTGLYLERLFAQTLRRRGSLMAGSNLLDRSTASLALGFMPGSGTPDSLSSQVTAAMPTGAAAADRFGATERQRDWAVWGALMGRATDTERSGVLPGWNSRTGGLAIGAERRFDGAAWPVLAGIAGGYTSTNVESGSSDSDIDSFHLGVYSASQIGALTLSGVASYAWQDYDFTRPIAFGGGAVPALGGAGGHTVSGSLEAFYDVIAGFGAGEGAVDNDRWGGLAIGPLATVDIARAERNGFTETGAGILNLTVAGQDVSQKVTGLGLAARFEQAIGQAVVMFDGRIAWEHVFGDRNMVTRSQIPLAGAAFITASAPVSQNRLAVGLGAALDISDGLSAHLRYDGSFSKSTNDHSGSAGATFRF